MALSPQYKKSAELYNNLAPGSMSLPQPPAPPPVAPDALQGAPQYGLGATQEYNPTARFSVSGVAPSRRLHDVESEPQYDEATPDELLDIGAQDPAYQRERYQDFLEDLRKRSEDRFNAAPANQLENKVSRQDLEDTRNAAQTRNLLGGLSQAFGQVSNVQGKGIESSLPKTFEGMNQADQEYLKGRQDLYKQGVGEEEAATKHRMELQGVQEQEYRKDPMSSVSKAYRDLISRVIKRPIDEDVSAEQLKELYPHIAKQIESENELASKKEDRNLQREFMTSSKEEQRKFQEEQNRLNREQKGEELMQRVQDRAADRDLKKELKSMNEAPIKQQQFKQANFARRLEQSEDVFNKLEQGGYNRADKLSALTSNLPGFMKSSEAQQQEQAERNFVNAVLRQESGAAISPSEFSNAEKQYFPRAGDSPEVLAQKKANRQQVMRSFEAEAGPALEKVELISPQGSSKAAAGAGHQQIKTYSPGSIPVAD